MANVVGSTWTSYGVGWPLTVGDSSAAASGIGNKEQFLGEITIIDPTDTPTFYLLGKDNWPAPYQEWPIDSLAATATGESIEAWDFSATALTGRTRYNNVTQAFHTGFLVSRRQQQMSQRGVTQGVGDEYRYQLGKKLLELNRNINARMIAAGTAIASATGASANVGSRTAALRAFPIVVTNVSGAFATGSFQSLHRKLDELGAMPDTLICSSGVKADISNQLLGLGSSTPYGSSPVRRVNMQQTDNEMKAVVEVIEDDFGRISVYRDRWLPKQTSTSSATAVTGTDLTAGSATAFVKVSAAGAYFLFDKSKVKIGIFQPPVHKPLPPNGDYERGFVVAEIATKVLHPSCIGLGGNVTETAI